MNELISYFIPVTHNSCLNECFVKVFLITFCFKIYTKTRDLFLIIVILTNANEAVYNQLQGFWDILYGFSSKTPLPFNA